MAVVSDWHFHAVLSSARGTQLVGAAKATAWEAGMRGRSRTMLGGVRQVVLLRDSPDLPGQRRRGAGVLQALRPRRAEPLRRHRAVALSRPRSGRPSSRAAASFPGRVVTIDLTTPTCPGGWCGPIDKPYLMFKDDNHWTQTYMRAHFAAPVERALRAAMSRA